jgi:L-fuculose-phosphate aldolase
MVGRMLVGYGLNNPFSGNISWRAREGFWITRTGIMKDNLKRKDFIYCKSHVPPRASVEASVHGAIYEKTDAGAVIHAHPPHAIVLSLDAETIIPHDVEGIHFLPKTPVLILSNPIGSEESALRVSQTLADYPCAVIRGHGIFTRGIDLREAFMFVCVLESTCRIILLRRLYESRL